jgi:hypothetical protein
MLDATNLRGIWHSDQSSEFVFNNTMVRRHVLGVRGQTDASSAGLDGDGNGKCIVGCRKKKVRRDYEGLLSAVSVFGVVLL